MRGWLPSSCQPFPTCRGRTPPHRSSPCPQGGQRGSQRDPRAPCKYGRRANAVGCEHLRVPTDAGDKLPGYTNTLPSRYSIRRGEQPQMPELANRRMQTLSEPPGARDVCVHTLRHIRTQYLIKYGQRTEPDEIWLGCGHRARLGSGFSLSSDSPQGSRAALPAPGPGRQPRVEPRGRDAEP